MSAAQRTPIAHTQRTPARLSQEHNMENEVIANPTQGGSRVLLDQAVVCSIARAPPQAVLKAKSQRVDIRLEPPRRSLGKVTQSQRECDLESRVKHLQLSERSMEKVIQKQAEETHIMTANHATTSAKDLAKVAKTKEVLRRCLRFHFAAAFINLTILSLLAAFPRNLTSASNLNRVWYGIEMLNC